MQVSDQLEAMIPHIMRPLKKAADTAHDSLGDIVDTVREMQDPLNKLHSATEGNQEWVGRYVRPGFSAESADAADH